MIEKPSLRDRRLIAPGVSVYVDSMPRRVLVYAWQYNGEHRAYLREDTSSYVLTRNTESIRVILDGTSVLKAISLMAAALRGQPVESSMIEFSTKSGWVLRAYDRRGSVIYGLREHGASDDIWTVSGAIQATWGSVMPPVEDTPVLKEEPVRPSLSTHQKNLILVMLQHGVAYEGHRAHGSTWTRLLAKGIVDRRMGSKFALTALGEEIAQELLKERHKKEEKEP